MASWQDDAETVQDSVPAGHWTEAAEPVEATPAPTPKPQTSTWEAIRRGATQGLTLGFGDEITGGLAAAYSQLLRRNAIRLTPQAQAQAQALGLRTPTQPSLADDYASFRDEERAANAKTQADHPWWYTGSDLAGGTLASLLMPGASLRGLSNGQKLLMLAKTAAPVGALAGLGSSNANSLSGLGLDTGLGAATGTLLPFGASKAAETLAPLLRSLGVDRAVEALGTKLGQYRSLDYKDAEQPLGQELMSKGLIPWFGRAKTIQQRVGSELESQGQTLGDLLQALDKKAGDSLSARQASAIPASGAQQPGLIPLSELHLDRVPKEQWSQSGDALPMNTRSERPAAVGAPATGSLLDLFVRPSIVRAQALKSIVAPMQEIPDIGVGNVPERLTQEIGTLTAPGDRMSLQKTNDLLRAMDARLEDAYDKEGNQMTEGLKRVRGILRGAQQDAAQRIDPELAARLKTAKGSYGNLAEAQKIINDTVLRNKSNHGISLMDLLAMGAGAGVGAPGGGEHSLLTALGSGGLSYLLRKSGNSLGANAAWRAANALEDPGIFGLLRNRQMLRAPGATLGSLLWGDHDQR